MGDGSEMGLSPLARGNPRINRPDGRHTGSIPARTGEPDSVQAGCDYIRVYPRSHGGTHRIQWIARQFQGLSPLARGNHGKRVQQGVVARSIPARTGEPDEGTSNFDLNGVYPRSHGGTLIQGVRGARSAGLSPLARGNRVQKLVY